MDRMLYISMTGAKQTMLSQATHANNMANVSTTGFRADFAQFRSMPVFGPGEPTRAYAQSERPATDFTAGPIESTGRELDIAIKGEGLIAVQARDGNEAYSRRGDLFVDTFGQLRDGTGLPVLGENGPIAVPPAQSLVIGVDGTINIVPLGEDPNVTVVLDRIRLVNPPLDQLEKGNDGLMRQVNGLPAPADAAVSVVSGALERSNVNIIESMVEMIATARKYEMQVKAMTTADELSQHSMRLLSLQ